MFNTEENTNTGSSETQGGPVTMEQLLGNKLSQAVLIEGGVWPSGMYAWQLTGINDNTYEIKAEDHPWIGEQATMVKLTLTCVDFDKDPKAKYLDKNKKRVSAETMASYVGKEFTENVMFGNDGLIREKTKEGSVYRLPQDGEVGEQGGYNKLVTLLRAFIGEDAYKNLSADGSDPQLPALIEACNNVKFGAEISHNSYGDNVNDQINLFGDFAVFE